MFCQLVYLRRCIPARIRRALTELPETLDETYARSLKEIDKPNWEYAHRLFQCVTAASRPFRVEELGEFLAFDFEAGATPAFLADWRPEDPMHTVLSTCSSLLAVVDEPTYPIFPALSPRSHTPTPPESPIIPWDGGEFYNPPDLDPAWTSYIIPPQVFQPPVPVNDDETYIPPEQFYPTSSSIELPPSPLLAAQFAHFSVKEYLTSARLAKEKDPISRFHVSMTAAHTIIAQACLGVLLHLDENVTKESLKKFPLAEYAAEHWLGHAQFENVASNVLDGMKRLFDPSKNHLSVWVWIYDPELPSWNRWERPERPTAARATPLHYAAFCGLHDVARFLIVQHSQDVNDRGIETEPRTPLHVALRRGHLEVARVLLEHGADTEARNSGDLTPLLWASKKGYAEVARDLLEHGADTEARDSDNHTPLLWASKKGYAEVARDLLEHGADTEARDGDNHTPLLWASEKGYVDVARDLLEHGADIEARGKDDWNPLDWASIGDVKFVQVLLEYGADANAGNGKWHTPLGTASSWGKPAAVRAFLEHGADVEARDKDNGTPLHEADEEGVVRLLLEHGADANALDIKNRTPLHYISEFGRVGAARVLLEHGVDANARDVNNATPLHLTSSSVCIYSAEERLDCAQLLLQYGSDIHARDDMGQTPFMRAAAKGYSEITHILLGHRAEEEDQKA